MLRTVVVMSILVPGLFLALQDRFKALLLYLWFAFFRPQDWMWLDISALKPSLVLGLVLVVPSLFSGIMPDVSHPLSIGALMFLGSAIAAQANAVNAQVGLDWIDFLTRLLLVCLLTTTIVNTPRRLAAVLAVVSGSFGFHAAKAGLASLMGGGIRFFDGLSGAFVDNNGYACGTVMIMPLLVTAGDNLGLLGFAATKPIVLTWLRRAFRIAVPLSAITVVSTYSRGGFLALATAGLVYIALHQKRVRLALALSAVVVLILLFVPMPDGYADRLETIQTYEEVGDDSAISRTHFWQVAMNMAEDQPLGIGLRNFEFAYDTYDFSHGRYGSHRAVHSSHFQVLAEMGYPGVLVWCGEFMIAIVVALRVRARSWTPGLSGEHARFLMSVANCTLASMFGFLVGGSFLGLALNDITWLTFALLASADRISAGLVEEAGRRPIAAAATSPASPVSWTPAPATTTPVGASWRYSA